MLKSSRSCEDEVADLNDSKNRPRWVTPFSICKHAVNVWYMLWANIYHREGFYSIGEKIVHLGVKAPNLA